MKILLPFKVHDGKKITDTKVMGGLERFAQLLLKSFENHPTIQIVPIEITKEDRNRGIATKKILGAARTKSNGLFAFDDDICDFDLILTNYEEDSYTTKLITEDGPPVAWIYHTGQDGTFGRVKSTRLFKEFTDAGGHLYFVSEHQKMLYDEMSQRILGHPVAKFDGYVNPAFCEGFETVYQGPREYDVVTIGRTSYIKDPFWVHQTLKDSDLTSAVITTGGNHLESGNEQKYYEKNQNWTSPRTVFRGLPHRDGLEKMSRGGVFVSTWPLETWGITALESLSHGIPTILLTDASLTHASQAIAADPSHIRCLEKKKTTVQEFEDTVKELLETTLDQRMEISRLTKEKHSKQAFIELYTKMFTDCINGKSNN
jgi:hypothetical protein